MANEIHANYAANKTVYAMVRNSVGQIWNVLAGDFEVYASANIDDYAITMTQQGIASAFYAGNFPSSIVAGVYSVIAKEQVSASPLESDPTIAVGEINWNGSIKIPLANLATSGQVAEFAPMRLAKGTMLNNFLFDLVSAADHITPFLSGTVSGQISRDGGSFTALQSGAFNEVGLGFYRLQAFTSGDLNATTAAVVFTANGVSGGVADPRRFSFVMQRTSGN